MPWWEDSKDGYDNYLHNKTQPQTTSAQPTRVVVIHKIVKQTKNRQPKSTVAWKNQQATMRQIGGVANTVVSRAQKLRESFTPQVKLQKMKRELARRQEREIISVETEKVRTQLKEQKARDRVNNPSAIGKIAGVVGSLFKKKSIYK